MIKNVILDTKVFVLYIVGLIDKEYIEKFIKTKEFSKREFEILLERINSFENIVITPHVLTEFSHFTLEVNGFRDDYKKVVKELLVGMQGGNLREEQSGILKILGNTKIYYLGIADVSLMEICTEDSVVITSDGRLADKLREDGKNALKFIPTAGFVNY